MLRPAWFRRWWLIAAFLLLTYVGSYLCLSRYSLWRNRSQSTYLFLYVPVSPERLVESKFLKHTHVSLAYVFKPLNDLDFALGGPAAGALPLRGISSSSESNK